jgi:parallel beta-helix repeat protein
MKRNLLFIVLALLATVEMASGQVMVAPNDNLQGLVKAHPAGTTFVLKPGVHHDSVSSLKDGDTFTGQAGAIENGAKVLAGWSQVTINSVTYWTTAGGTPVSTGYKATNCQQGFPGCFYPQDLYLDNVTYTHVTSLSDVAADKWYYDYSGGDGGAVNNIYLASSENPNSHTVELGVTKKLFESANAQNITIQGLIVEKYAGDIDHGPISASWIGCNGCTASGWIIQNNEVRLCRMVGIKTGNGSTNIQILNNTVHHNGQFGIGGGSSTRLTLKGNRIYSNNTDHVNSGYGAGGFKAGKTTGAVVSYNEVHDDDGHGLWSDTDSQNITFDHNTVYNETGPGIHIEISNQQIVTNNTCYGNGSSQIQVVSSSNVSVQHNTVTATATAPGIDVFYSSSRDAEHPDFTFPAGLLIAHNTITIASGQKAVRVIDNGGTASRWALPNMLNLNTYCVPSLPWTEKSWAWGGGAMNWTAWQSHESPAGTVKASPCSGPVTSGSQ